MMPGRTGAAPAEQQGAAEPDEPPSRPPSGSRVTTTVSVLAADERSSETSGQVPADLDALASLLGRALAAEGIPAGAEASLTLVDPDEIARLKAEHLDGDGEPTDVLSFPIDGADRPLGDTTDWMVGDVVLCPQVAAAQAPGHAGTVEDELALLVVHGALHLVGWDHATDAERHQMWDRERQLLTELHRAPARDPWSATPQ